MRIRFIRVSSSPSLGNYFRDCDDIWRAKYQHYLTDLDVLVRWRSLPEVIAAGWLAYGLFYLCLGFVSPGNSVLLFGLFAFYGLFLAATEGVEKALVVGGLNKPTILNSTSDDDNQIAILWLFAPPSTSLSSFNSSALTPVPNKCSTALSLKKFENKYNG